MSVSALHFFYKLKCAADGTIPVQCVWHSSIASSDCEYPDHEAEYRDEGVDFFTTFPHLGCYDSDISNRIWCEFQNLAVRLRTGSCCSEEIFSSRDSDDASIMQLVSPSPDHALAYSVLEDTGIVAIGLATLESEIYVAFPGTISPLDACGSVTYLNRTLKQSGNHMFQFTRV